MKHKIRGIPNRLARVFHSKPLAKEIGKAVLGLSSTSESDERGPAKLSELAACRGFKTILLLLGCKFVMTAVQVSIQTSWTQFTVSSKPGATPDLLPDWRQSPPVIASSARHGYTGTGCKTSAVFEGIPGVPRDAGLKKGPPRSLFRNS